MTTPEVNGSELRSRNRRAAGRLLLVVLGMFGFGYALVPLYGVFCEITGINGRTGTVQADQLPQRIDDARLITVEFVGNVNSALPLELYPLQERIQVHPGGVYEVRFFARNVADVATTAQAVPSVSPATASKYFKKIECFCFTNQAFAPNEGREMPVVFVIEPGFPKELSTVTLGYTFFHASGDS